MQSILLRAAALLIFLLACVSSSMGAETKSKYSVAEQRVLYKAQRAMDRENYPRVRKLLAAYLEEHPETQHALFFLFLGHACSQQKDIAQAKKWFQKGFDKNPDNLFLCRNLAAMYYRQEQFAKAGQLFAKGYKLSNPSEPDLLYQAATAFYQAKQLGQALKVLEQLLSGKGKPRKEWLSLMIQVCYEKRDLKRCASRLETYLEAYPWERTYWKVLAGIRLEQEQYPKAAAALRTAIMSGNATKQEWSELASLYFYMDAPLQGTKCLEKTLGNSPSAKDYDVLAKGYLLAHRTDKGLHYLDAAIAKKPTSKRLIMKAKALMASRRFTDAEATLQKVLEMQSGSKDEAWLLMAYCSVEQQEWKQAQTRLYHVKDDKFKDYAKAVMSSISPLLEQMASDEE